MYITTSVEILMESSNPLTGCEVHQYFNRVCTYLHVSYTFLFDNGNRFRLHFDFKERVCKAYYNERTIGLLTADLPARIHIAASVYYHGTAVETTLFAVR